MEIKLQLLHLENFKGAKNVTVNFEDRTDISGQNRSGKTTLFDAFTWLLFGKDSSGRKDFAVKTLDEKNQAIPKIDHSVEANIEKDGTIINLKRTYREKWVKRRGEATTTMDGHETLFWVNGVPLSQAEYQREVSSIIQEDTFKLLTSPYYFQSLDWKLKRSLLIAMTGGEVSDQEVAGDNEAFQKLLASGKDLDRYKAELSAKKKKLKDQLAEIPTRIDENNSILTDPVDLAATQKQIQTLEELIRTLDASIQSENTRYEKANQKIRETSQKIHELKLKLQEIENRIIRDKNTVLHNYEQNLQLAETDLKATKGLLSFYNTETETVKGQIKELQERKQKLYDRYDQEDAKSWTIEQIKAQDTCPTCKQHLPEETILSKKQEILKNFNEEKLNTLDGIRAEGKSVAERLEKAENLLEANKKFIEEINKKLISQQEVLDNLKVNKPTETPATGINLSEDAEYVFISNQIEVLQNSMKEVPPANTEELNKERFEYASQLDIQKSMIQRHQRDEQTRQRIKELSAQELDLSQQIADLENQEYTIDLFNKTKINLVESRINQKFKFVSFKMFEQLINGGEEPTCITLINGVPYSDANDAAKINAGIDIINAFSKFHDTYAPIFVDRAESVNELIPSDSQVIRLIVSEEESLTIRSKKFQIN